MQLKQLKKLESMRSSILWLSLSAAALGGCSGSGTVTGSSGNSGGNNGDVSTLQIVAPKTIFSKPAESSPGYIVIKNPTNAAVSNIHYDLSNLVGGASGSTIDPASAASCATMPAHGQCNKSNDSSWSRGR